MFLDALTAPLCHGSMKFDRKELLKGAFFVVFRIWLLEITVSFLQLVFFWKNTNMVPWQ